MKLAVVTVSVREGRIGNKIAKWAYDYASKSKIFETVDSIDLKEIDLPVFSETNHPIAQQYQQPKTKEWAKLVDQYDAYLFVTPEYDYFAPSSLVNAIQYLSKEWAYKPAGFVGYGGLSGGLRSIQAVKPLVTTVKMMPMSETVSFHFAWDNLSEDSVNAEKMHEESADGLLAEMHRWATALKTLR